MSETLMEDILADRDFLPEMLTHRWRLSKPKAGLAAATRLHREWATEDHKSEV
jgi:hypothetical protein